MHPLYLNLCEVRIELGHGIEAIGSGAIDLVTPWGPRLTFEGDIANGEDGFTYLKRSAENSHPAGHLYRPPVLQFHAVSDALRVHGAWHNRGSQTFTGSGSVHGEYAPHRVVVKPGGTPETLIVGPPPAASVDTGRRHGSIGR